MIGLLRPSDLGKRVCQIEVDVDHEYRCPGTLRQLEALLEGNHGLLIVVVTKRISHDLLLEIASAVPQLRDVCIGPELLCRPIDLLLCRLEVASGHQHARCSEMAVAFNTFVAASARLGDTFLECFEGLGISSLAVLDPGQHLIVLGELDVLAARAMILAGLLQQADRFVGLALGLRDLPQDLERGPARVGIEQLVRERHRGVDVIAAPQGVRVARAGHGYLGALVLSLADDDGLALGTVAAHRLTVELRIALQIDAYAEHAQRSDYGSCCDPHDAPPLDPRGASNGGALTLQCWSHAQVAPLPSNTRRPITRF